MQSGTPRDDETNPGETAGPFKWTTISPEPGNLPPTETYAVADRIGDFVIRSVIGEGGMGLVYQAEQQSPKRLVALKVVRPEMVSAKLLKRFEYEAELLGRLEHASIARIYQAGTATTPHGSRPFFAMEFVHGRPLNDFVEQTSASVKERLRLIVEIARAVHYAHQQGIIHRDLKPGNILVTDTGVPKILDFGVARLSDSDVQRATMQTDVGQLVGTLPYMSPEQAGGDPADLDTRSDVYALGVITYEALATELPYQLGKRMLHDAVRIIREQEPSRLSTVDPSLRGDIETIVAKALEKDKTRRYQSAAELADDITRYLRDEPIVARPASAAYQMKKFAQRNRALVVAAAAVVAALVVGVIASTAFAIDANRQRAIAQATAVREQAQREEAEKQKAEAEKQKAEAERRERESQAVIRFLNTDVFASATPQYMPDKTVRDEIVAKMLKPAAANAREKFKDEPLVAATVMNQIGYCFKELGYADECEPLYKDSLDIRRRLLGDDHPDTITSVSNYASVLDSLGRSKEAEPLYKDALDRRRRVLGNESFETVHAISNYAFVLDSLGRRAESVPIYQEAIERSRKVIGEDHTYTLQIIGNYVSVLNALGRSAEAEPISRDLMERQRRAQGEDHPETITAMARYAFVLDTLGRAVEAEPIYKDVLDRRRRIFGPDHALTITSLNNYATVLVALNRSAEAEPLYKETLERRTRVQGGDHPDTIAAMTNYANALNQLGRSAEAEPVIRETLARSQRVLGETHPTTINALHHVAYTLSLLGRNAEAEPLMRQAVRQATTHPSLGANHPRTKRYVGRYLAILVALDLRADAAAVARLFSMADPTTQAATQPTQAPSADEAAAVHDFTGWLKENIPVP